MRKEQTMAKTLRSVWAGPVQIHSLSSRGKRGDSPAQRAAKHKASSEAQRRMNHIYAYQRLELQLAANFPTAGSAHVVTLTYDDEHMPHDRTGVNKNIAAFRRKLNALRRKADLPELIMFWGIEVLTSASGRWHVHAAINNTGKDYAMIREAWRWGCEIEIKPLRVDDEKNHETLARYMTKEAREAQDYISRPNTLSYSHTRNIVQPERETRVVADDYEIEVPEEAVVLLDECRSTVYAGYRVLKLRLPYAAKTPKARRRRRKR